MVARLFWLTTLLIASPLARADASASPRELPSREVLEAACTPGPCPIATQIDQAIERAGRWLVAYPEPLRFDAAIMLSHVRRFVDNDALRTAYAQAREVADRDHDHPHRRVWLPDFSSPPEHTSRWQAPAVGEARINTNRVISEALHCAENGWREQTEAYICGPMRDAAGFHSTHALWALDIARRAGCLRDGACIAELQQELEAVQPADFRPETTLDVDLYAERVLMLLRTGREPVAARSWVEALLALQEPAGSWGKGEDRNPYFRYHATAMTAWALAEWQALQAKDER